MDEASEQAWNQVAHIQIKPFLRVFCFGLLSAFVFLSLCCPDCLFLVAVASKWQCLREAEAPVLLPLQHVLELMHTNSSVDGKRETFTWHSSACPLWLAGSKPTASYLSAWESLPSKLMDIWGRKANSRNRVSEKLPTILPSSRKGAKNLCYFVSTNTMAFLNKMLPVDAWMSAGYDFVICCLLSVQWGCFPGSAPLLPMCWRQWVMLLRHVKIKKKIRRN